MGRRSTVQVTGAEDPLVDPAGLVELPPTIPADSPATEIVAAPNVKDAFDSRVPAHVP